MNLSKHLEEQKRKFDKRFSGYNLDGYKYYDFSPLDVKDFIHQSNLSTIQKIREMIEGQRQSIMEMATSSPKQWVIKSGEIKALDDILSQLTVEDDEKNN